ncbi:hypothetical protein QBC34DRAFT_153287 [Podospora aff. communis PSN243]|uniref:C2H2-type domain-containing protein n=1 Tax=Podospora aff. communis PSN243 TaxID=3040156 RepID=A0AAV9GCA2_9PEZI|nr:hypothetical protein QBC34DRAFT_153287 [Podospora aff. communis PSN243]
MHPFVVPDTYGLLICQVCQYAVVVRQASGHLRTKHRTIPASEQKAILRTIQHLPVMQSNDERIVYQLPAEPVQPLPCLKGPYEDGYACTTLGCMYIVRGLRTIQEHCRVKHGWVNPNEKGGDHKKRAQIPASTEWRTNVRCQRFFESGVKSTYFEVFPPPPSAPLAHQVLADPYDSGTIDFSQPESSTPVSTGLSYVDQLLQGFSDAASRTTSIIQNNEGKTEPNPWLRRVGWAEQFAGRDCRYIYRTVSTNIQEGWHLEDSTQQQVELQVAYDSLERVIRAAQKSCTAEEVGVAVLFEIGRKAIDTKPHTPFSSQLEPRTIQRYTRVWKQILSYIFRTVDLPEDDQMPYIWTDGQTKDFERLRQAIRQTTRTNDQQNVDRTMLDFLVSLLDHPLAADAYDSVLLSALAAIGAREDGSWLQPDIYTGIYSAVVKVARMLVVQQSLLEDEDGDGLGEIFPIVRTKVRRFMTLNHKEVLPTPIDWIFDARTYGLKILYTTAAVGHVAWNGTTIAYRTVTLSIDGFSEMLHKLVEQLSCMMAQLTFADSGIQAPPVQIGELYDDMGNDNVGYSFVKDPQNVSLQGLDQWLVRHITSNPDAAKRLFRGDPNFTGTLRTDKVEGYIRLVNEFRRLLLILTHLLGGQPARATEILSVRHTNTAYGGIRNIFIQSKMLCLVTYYHKGYALQGQTKVVHRYLPDILGVLFVRYLTIVLPFAQTLLIGIGSGTELSSFMWSAQLVRPATSRTTDKDFPTLWSSDRVRRALQDLAARHLGTPLQISSWRHIAIAIGRRYLQPYFKPDSVDTSYDNSDAEDEDQVPDNILDVQATHSTHVAEIVYGRTIFQGFWSIGTRQEEFHKASKMWHALFGFYPSDVSRLRQPKLMLFEKERYIVRQRRLQRLQAVNLLGQFRQLLRNPSATFRGNQEDAAVAVVQGSTPILQVTATGGGKSVTFLLPSYATPDGTTIVIVPFVALQMICTIGSERQISDVQSGQMRVHTMRAFFW